MPYSICLKPISPLLFTEARLIEIVYCGISQGSSPSFSFGSVLADHQVVYCSQRRNSDGSRTVLRIESCHTHIQDLVGDQLVLTNDYKVNSNKKKSSSIPLYMQQIYPFQQKRTLIIRGGELFFTIVVRSESPTSF